MVVNDKLCKPKWLKDYNKRMGPKLKFVQERPIKTIPRISMDEKIDYEFDEYDNYQRFGIFQGIVFALCYLFYKIINVFKMDDVDNVQLIDCVICFEQYPENRLLSCYAKHQICGKCFRQTLKNHIFPFSLEQLTKGFPCPDYSCKQYIRYEKYTKFIPIKTRHHIQNKIYESVFNTKKLQYDQCKYCGKISETIKNRIFHCSSCNYTVCYYCVKEFKPTEPEHSYQKCVEMERKMHQNNDKLSEALMHRCYKCKVPFLKIGGLQEACNIMTCKCGASQCYACRMPAGNGHKCSSFYSSANTIHNKDLQIAKKILNFELKV